MIVSRMGSMCSKHYEAGGSTQDSDVGLGLGCGRFVEKLSDGRVGQESAKY